MASERLLDEALTQRRWDVLQERAQDIRAFEVDKSEAVSSLSAARAPYISSTQSQ